VKVNPDVFYISAQKPKKNSQDYAIHGDNPTPYVIICDGCSGANYEDGNFLVNHTDVGARILAHSAKRALSIMFKVITTYNVNEDNWYKQFGDFTIQFAKQAIDSFGLDSSCLSSTLIISFAINEKICTMIYGDGFIFRVGRDGKVYTRYIDFKNNAPYYLQYLINNGANKNYIKGVGEEINESQTNYELYEDDLKITKTKYDSPIIYVCDISDTSMVMVTSDGINSFTDHNSKAHIDYDIILQKLLAIKNPTGVYIQRRAGRMLDDLIAANILNWDDFSVGALSITEE
jgi:hypothetical protein